MALITARLAVDWGVTDKVGTLAYRIVGPLGTHVARTTTGVTANLVSGKSYYVDRVLDTAWVGALILWDDGTDEVSESIEPYFVSTRATPGDIPGAAIGPGANQCTITWTNSTTGLPVADGDVWITTDTSGSNVIAGTTQTNSGGQRMFLLDAGATYYLWAQKDGVEPILGQQFAAAED